MQERDLNEFDEAAWVGFLEDVLPARANRMNSLSESKALDFSIMQDHRDTSSQREGWNQNRQVEAFLHHRQTSGSIPSSSLLVKTTLPTI